MIANRDEIEAAERNAGSPGERDLQIYAAVRVEGRRQVDVAAEFGITQGRVSQIVGRVNHWRLSMGFDAELERRDRKSVDRWLAHLRIEKLYEETMELYRRSRSPRRKERRVKNQQGESSTETIDHQVGNLQCLKFAGRLLALQWELEVDERPDQSASSPRSRLDEYEAFRMLVDMRDDAIRRGDVPEGEHSESVVRRMVDEMVGSRPHVCPQAPARATSATAAQGAAEPDQGAAVISDISAAAAAEAEGARLASNDPETTCDAEPPASPASAEANIGEIFHARSPVRATDPEQIDTAMERAGVGTS